MRYGLIDLRDRLYDLWRHLGLYTHPVRHEPLDVLLLGRIYTEVLGELLGCRQFLGGALRACVDETQGLELADVVVHLRSQHILEIGLEDGLVVGDQGEGTQ